MQEEPMPGGRTTDAVRVGDAVHRPARPWTPAVHAVLRHLEARDFAGAPRVLGWDDRGREVVTFLPGDVVGESRPWPGWVFSDETLVRVGGWMRALHDATADFVPPADARWFAGQSWRPGLVIGHHDAAPYNAVRRADGSVAFVDWDTAGPGPRELDLAFTALWWVPLQPPRVVEELGFPGPGDRSRRLHLLLDAYGFRGDRAGFGTAVAGRARTNASVIRRLADAGDPVFTALLPTALALEEAARDVEALPAEFWTPPATH